jgi:hypothetical protein
MAAGCWVEVTYLAASSVASSGSGSLSVKKAGVLARRPTVESMRIRVHKDGAGSWWLGWGSPSPTAIKDGPAQVARWLGEKGIIPGRDGFVFDSAGAKADFMAFLDSCRSPGLDSGPV